MADNIPLPLSGALRELKAEDYNCDRINYRQLWQGAVEQRFPAHQRNRVWHFYPDDIPKIAAALGLLKHEKAPAIGREQRRSLAPPATSPPRRKPRASGSARNTLSTIETVA